MDLAKGKEGAGTEEEGLLVEAEIFQEYWPCLRVVLESMVLGISHARDVRQVVLEPSQVGEMEFG